MQIQKIGTRGVLFTFSDLLGTEYDCTTNVYVIEGREYVFLCDTFIGPVPMEKVKEYIYVHMGRKPVIIFNSHSDWDHIWGNCAFDTSMIIGQRACRDRVKKEGQLELEQYGEYKKGPVQIVPPSLTFEERISFPEEGLEFFHSPGHTRDSSSCYDRVDRVLYVGDNIEEPIPYINTDNLEDYSKTLAGYLTMRAEIVIPGHGPVGDKGLVKNNLSYLQRLLTGEHEEITSEKHQRIHQSNVEILQKLPVK